MNKITCPNGKIIFEDEDNNENILFEQMYIDEGWYDFERPSAGHHFSFYLKNKKCLANYDYEFSSGSISLNDIKFENFENISKNKLEKLIKLIVFL